MMKHKLAAVIEVALQVQHMLILFEVTKPCHTKLLTLTSDHSQAHNVNLKQ